MRKLILVLAGMAVLPLYSSCGILDSGASVRISLPTMSFDFSFDLADIRSAIKDRTGYDLSSLETIPEQIDIKDTFELTTAPYKQDLTDQEKLKAYIEAGHVKSVRIKFVRYTIVGNTLNYDVPVIELFVGEYAITNIDQTVKVAEIPKIEIGFIGDGEVQFVDGGRDTLTTQLMKLKFALMGMTKLLIDTDINRAVPDGLISGKVEFGLEFTVDPL